MSKLIDVDKLFSDFAPQFIATNYANCEPDEIEEKIDEIYYHFGNTKLSELGDKTVVEYFESFTADELVDMLFKYVLSGVDPSAYLTDALVSKDGGEDALLALLKSDNEDLIVYAMNLLSDKGVAPKAEYLDYILDGYGDNVAELATELLSTNASIVTDKILAEYDSAPISKKVNLIEILANAPKSDKVFEILINAFIENKQNLPLYAYYLSKYGDDKALPYLYDAIESDDIDYGDYQELKCAIEVLGGECKVKKDFSQDKAFLAVKKVDEEINN